MTDLPYHHDWKPLFETSLGLRVKWFGRWGEDPDWSIEPSRLASDLVCFFYLEKGTCSAVVNGVNVPMQPGELVVLRSGDVFSFSQDQSRIQTSLSACLSLNQDDSSNVLLRHHYLRHYRLQNREIYVQRFSEVLESLKSSNRWRNLKISAAIFQWLVEVQEALHPEAGSAEANSKVVQHVLASQQWMQHRLGEDVSIVDCARACGLNTDYFSRVFKLHTGVTPKAWLIERRLQRACQLLANHDESVGVVAYQCGFNCPFHFSRSFKRRFGIPPASYRRVRQVHGFEEA